MEKHEQVYFGFELEINNLVKELIDALMKKLPLGYIRDNYIDEWEDSMSAFSDFMKHGVALRDKAIQDAKYGPTTRKINELFRKKQLEVMSAGKK